MSSGTSNATQYPRFRVSGTAYERSREYGALARIEVQRTREGYERVFEAKGVPWRDAVEYALKFTASIELYFPEYLAEMRGIADGAGLPFEDILTMNCRTEVLWRAAVQRAGSLSPELRGECSSFALEPDRTKAGCALVGQNWDWLDVLADSVIVLEVEREDGPNYVTIVEAGLLAKTTMNQAGIAIGINTIVCSLDGINRGVPFHVLVRAVADAEHVSDVVEIVSSSPRASSGNYIVASENGSILNVETAPGDARAVHPIHSENGALVHTNHFVRAPTGGFDLAPMQMADSFVRYGRMSRLVSQCPDTLSVEDLQLALADHVDAPSAVCCHPDGRAKRATQWATLVSVVMDPAARSLHLSEGKPCIAPWTTHDYSGFLGR